MRRTEIRLSERFASTSASTRHCRVRSVTSRLGSGTNDCSDSGLLLQLRAPTLTHPRSPGQLHLRRSLRPPFRIARGRLYLRPDLKMVQPRRRHLSGTPRLRSMRSLTMARNPRMATVAIGGPLQTRLCLPSPTSQATHSRHGTQCRPMCRQEMCRLTCNNHMSSRRLIRMRSILSTMPILQQQVRRCTRRWLHHRLDQFCHRHQA